MLAPVPASEGRAAPQAPSGDEDEEPSPLIPDELSEGGADSLDDGTTDQDIPVARARLPSSFGMTFCVDAEATKLKVTAEWGQYLRERKEEDIDEKTGRPRLVWKRYQRGGSTVLTLKDGPIARMALDPNCPAVFVQGQVRKRDQHFVVTLFPVNGQEEPTQRKDEAHLFQPKLVVEAPDGSAIFQKRLQRPNASAVDKATRLEEDTLAMLHRHLVEFAVGHPVSVH